MTKPTMPAPADPPGWGITLPEPVWLNPGQTAESREYHSHPALGQSSLKSWLSDPADYEARVIKRDITQPAPSAAMAWGLDLENLIFYDHLTGGTRVVVIPEEVLSEKGERRGKAWVEFKALYDGQPNVVLKKRSEMEREMGLYRAVENVRQHPEARGLLWGGDRIQVGYAWTDQPTGLALKAQADVAHADVIVDLKSTRDPSPDGFANSIAEYGYHLQAYHYRQGYHVLTGTTARVAFVCVRNRAPWDVAVYVLDDEWYDIAARQWEAAKGAYAACCRSGQWSPKWLHGYQILQPPVRSYRLEQWDGRIAKAGAAQ